MLRSGWRSPAAGRRSQGRRNCHRQPVGNVLRHSLIVMKEGCGVAFRPKGAGPGVPDYSAGATCDASARRPLWQRGSPVEPDQMWLYRRRGGKPTGAGIVRTDCPAIPATGLLWRCRKIRRQLPRSCAASDQGSRAARLKAGAERVARAMMAPVPMLPNTAQTPSIGIRSLLAVLNTFMALTSRLSIRSTQLMQDRFQNLLTEIFAPQHPHECA